MIYDLFFLKIYINSGIVSYLLKDIKGKQFPIDAREKASERIPSGNI